MWCHLLGAYWAKGNGTQLKLEKVTGLNGLVGIGVRKQAVSCAFESHVNLKFSVWHCNFKRCTQEPSGYH